MNVSWYDVVSVWKDYNHVTISETMSVYNNFINDKIQRPEFAADSLYVRKTTLSNLGASLRQHEVLIFRQYGRNL